MLFRSIVTSAHRFSQDLQTKTWHCSSTLRCLMRVHKELNASNIEIINCMRIGAFTSVIALFLILLTCSCSQSREDKVQDIIANYMKANFRNYDSYEPLEVRIDSSFTSLEQNEKAVNTMMEILSIIESAHEYRSKIDDAERSMEIYSITGGASYRQTKRDRDEYQRLLDRSRDRVGQAFDKLKDIDKHIGVGLFNGWIVFHKYRFHVNWKEHDYDKIDTVVFLCDKDYTIKEAYSLDEYDALLVLMNSVKESEDIESWFDEVQDIMTSNKHRIGSY